MEIQLNVALIKNSGLRPDQLTFLLLMYHKKWDDIKDIFGVKDAVLLRDTLVDTPYILSTGRVTETIISRKHVEKLFGLRSDSINFWEFYCIYPVKVGSRVLRGAKQGAQVVKKHEEKYLKRIKTLEQHKLAMASVENFVARKRQANELKFLPGMDVVLNNHLWEQWEVLLEEKGTEGKEWNITSI